MLSFLFFFPFPLVSCLTWCSTISPSMPIGLIFSPSFSSAHASPPPNAFFFYIFHLISSFALLSPLACPYPRMSLIMSFSGPFLRPPSEMRSGIRDIKTRLRLLNDPGIAIELEASGICARACSLFGVT